MDPFGKKEMLALPYLIGTSTLLWAESRGGRETEDSALSVRPHRRSEASCEEERQHQGKAVPGTG